MQKARMLVAGLTLLILLTSSLPAAQVGDLSYGADLRFRQTSLEDVPLRNGGAIAMWSFFRIRPRVWAQYQISDNMLVRTQITNEFRKWLEPEHRNSYKFPDEWLIDNLYLDLKNLAGGKLDMRIGRQNIIYGTGKIILDGTPGDGSRTIYMDAIKATWKGFANMTVDLLGIYDFAENPLAINGQKLNLTNLTPADVKREANELGGGLYLKHKGFKEGWPFEAYYLFKQEAEYTLASGAKNPSVSYSTIGARVMPKLSDSLTGNLELAYQMGSADAFDISGYMLDAKLTMAVPAMQQHKPKASVGLYLLSGNDPDTADDEAWRPPFSRWPQYSELYIYSYATDRASVADWQNVLMPYFECSAALGADVTSTALLGYMNAMQDDGPGDGKARGLLFTWWNKFNIAKGLLREKDGLTGHLLIEAVKPGDYYVTETASLFFRWELLYSIQ